ncbi:hypothetical protein [Leisingera sp. ANG-M6]|uniref:hypothetical protein n=1 Tax=Leisingera sp. ANG-M6 TaxID=1577900 RepID=UPI00057C8859|nr:hypothetical protein [Leisingera sp. ANG-M6]KIC26774.1 hypothetical protein RA24_18140 [Leisingera sp. ANG-M6]
MISAVSSPAGFYNGMKQIQALRQEAPASGTTARELADASLIKGMTRTPARDAVQAGSPADALTAQYVGPAREMARAEALEPRPAKGIDMDAYYQDLMNGCQAGPKPVSVLTAEANYAKVQRIIG